MGKSHEIHDRYCCFAQASWEIGWFIDSVLTCVIEFPCGWKGHSLFPLAYRNPNGEGLVEWPSYNLNEEYLQINLQQKKDRKLKEKKVEFWKKVMLEKTNKKSTQNKKFKLEL